MHYVPQKDDNDFTTLRITKGIRRKLGMMVNKNENLDVGLERILDSELKITK